MKIFGRRFDGSSRDHDVWVDDPESIPEMPNYTLEEAIEIGRVAGELVASGEWEKIEETLKKGVGSLSINGNEFD